MNDTPHDISHVHPAGPDSTKLAMERTHLSYERTLMAWIRTSLSMITFGFTLGKLAQFLHDVQTKGASTVLVPAGIKELAYLLVILGTLALLGASYQYWWRSRSLRRLGYPSHFDLTFTIGLCLSVIGFFAIASLMRAI
jgi:putative membrane protein